MQGFALLANRFDVDRDIDIGADGRLAAVDGPCGAVELCGGFSAREMCAFHAWAAAEAVDVERVLDEVRDVFLGALSGEDEDLLAFGPDFEGLLLGLKKLGSCFRAVGRAVSHTARFDREI